MSPIIALAPFQTGKFTISIDDLIIIERERNTSVFKRYDEKDFQGWLEEYSVGELWEKNILGGRPG